MKLPLLECKQITIQHQQQMRPTIKKLDLTIYPNEIIGLVGASGCGKSTLAKAIVGIYPLTEGEIHFNEHLLSSPKKQFHHLFRKEIQLVFQNPSACLNPRMSILSTLLEPLVIHEKTLSKKEKLDCVDEILNQVGLPSSFLGRYPHELSGGQKQRVCVARSLILKPNFLIFDEAVSALDASIQAHILNLLIKLKNKLNFTLLFISHDLPIVHYLSDRIAVMAEGSIVEISTPEVLFHHPTHSYTKKLLSLC